MELLLWIGIFLAGYLGIGLGIILTYPIIAHLPEFLLMPFLPAVLFWGKILDMMGY